MKTILNSDTGARIDVDLPRVSGTEWLDTMCSFAGMDRRHGKWQVDATEMTIILFHLQEQIWNLREQMIRNAATPKRKSVKPKGSRSK